MLLLFCWMLSCQPEQSSSTQQPSAPQKVSSQGQKINEELLVANKMVLKKEQDEFTVYAREHALDFVKTPRGVWMHVYAHHPKGRPIKAGDRIQMSYTLSLMSGVVCDSSSVAPKPFLVSEQEAESGLHYGLMLLKTGDKALLLLPSSRAQGLLGDLARIPPQSPLIYQIEIEP